jgi:preprotein translocase subunit YajC
MSLLVSDAYAQSAGGAMGGGGVGQIIILVVFVGVFYFLLIRPQQKRLKDQRLPAGASSAGLLKLTIPS